MKNTELARKGMKQVRSDAKRKRHINAAWEAGLESLPMHEQALVEIARDRLREQIPNLGAKGSMEVLMRIGALLDEAEAET